MSLNQILQQPSPLPSNLPTVLPPKNIRVGDLVVDSVAIGDLLPGSVVYAAPTGATGTLATDSGFTWTLASQRLVLGPTGVSIGVNAGSASQAPHTIAIGTSAGLTSQGTQSIAIGRLAGTSTQATNAIAIGVSAGQLAQGGYAIAIGASAGNTGQGADAIAIGDTAGQTSQGANAVAIGRQAGQWTQGSNAVAIGYLAGITGQASGSICLNASGAAVVPTQAGFYVAPIRTQAIAADSLVLGYTGTELVINSSKTFVVDHPLKPHTHFLQHACLEGPEAGVYYRGASAIPLGVAEVRVDLPDYVTGLACDLTVHVTPIGHFELLCADDVSQKGFLVKAANKPLDAPWKFHWQVTGKRKHLEVEVSKDSAKLVGQAPYVSLVSK